MNEISEMGEPGKILTLSTTFSGQRDLNSSIQTLVSYVCSKGQDHRHLSLNWVFCSVPKKETTAKLFKPAQITQCW